MPSSLYFISHVKYLLASHFLSNHSFVRILFKYPYPLNESLYIYTFNLTEFQKYVSSSLLYLWPALSAGLAVAE